MDANAEEKRIRTADGRRFTQMKRRLLRSAHGVWASSGADGQTADYPRDLQ